MLQPYWTSLSLVSWLSRPRDLKLPCKLPLNCSLSLVIAKLTAESTHSDFHGRLHKGMAKQLAVLLEPHRPYFIEEPLLPGHIPELKEYMGHTAVPVALGERLYSRLDVRPYLVSMRCEV